MCEVKCYARGQAERDAPIAAHSREATQSGARLQVLLTTRFCVIGQLSVNRVFPEHKRICLVLVTKWLIFVGAVARYVSRRFISALDPGAEDCIATQDELSVYGKACASNVSTQYI